MVSQRTHIPTVGGETQMRIGSSKMSRVHRVLNGYFFFFWFFRFGILIVTM